MLVDLQDESALPTLRRALADHRPQIRAAALAGWSRYSKHHYRPVAIEALEDKDPGVRGEAVRLLAHLRDPSLARLLSETLRREDREQTRLEAALGLGRLQDADALKVVAELAQDKRTEVRRAAAIAFRESRNPKAIPSLLPLVSNDSDPLVRKIALEGLGMTADPNILPAAQKALSDPHPEVRRTALEVLDPFRDPSSLPFLVAALRDPEEALGEKAAHLLAETGDSRCVPDLLNLLGNLRPEVRGRAAFLLGRLGDKNVIPAIGRMVPKGSAVPALRALESLALRRDKRTLPWMVLGLSNPDFTVHREANRLLLQVPYSRVPEFLIDLLEEMDPSVRLAAAQALGWMKNPSSTAALRRSFHEDPDPLVRAASGKALRSLQGRRRFKTLLAAAILTAGSLAWGWLFSDWNLGRPLGRPSQPASPTIPGPKPQNPVQGPATLSAGR